VVARRAGISSAQCLGTVDHDRLPDKASGWNDLARFARLAKSHNGVWGGCWCMAFHGEGVGRNKTAAQNRSENECRDGEGHAHAALVYQGPTCIGWCHFGPTDELPRIKRRKRSPSWSERRSGLPDHMLLRRQSVPAQGSASAGLEGALREIARLGGAEERLRAIPRTSRTGLSRRRFFTTARCRCSKPMGSRVRRLGKCHWVVTKVVD